MPKCKRSNFKKQLAGASIGLAISITAIPIAVLVTIILNPLWSWLEASLTIEAIGHSGPAEWCYLVSYMSIITSAGFIWSALRWQRQAGKR